MAHPACPCHRPQPQARPGQQHLGGSLRDQVWAVVATHWRCREGSSPPPPSPPAPPVRACPNCVVHAFFAHAPHPTPASPLRVCTHRCWCVRAPVCPAVAQCRVCLCVCVRACMRACVHARARAHRPAGRAGGRAGALRFCERIEGWESDGSRGGAGGTPGVPRPPVPGHAVALADLAAASGPARRPGWLGCGWQWKRCQGTRTCGYWPPVAAHVTRYRCRVRAPRACAACAACVGRVRAPRACPPSPPPSLPSLQLPPSLRPPHLPPPTLLPATTSR